jgi:hypothetical protein
VPEAPNDGQQYARKSLAWSVVVGGGGGITEAPTDGKQYGRVGSTTSWTEVLPNPTWTTLTGKPSTFPPTLPIAESDVTNLTTDLAGKEPVIASGTTAQYWKGNKTWATLDKAAVGLGNVDNTSDATKPVSTPQQTALNLKADLNAPIFTGDARAVTPATADNDTSIATTAFVQTNMGLKVSKTGDTMTGNLNIYPASSATLTMNKPSSGQQVSVEGRMNNASRWRVALGDTTAESGANSGSNFALERCDDAGTFIDQPLSINRATAIANFTGNLTIAKATPALAFNRTAGTAGGLQGQTAGSTRWNLVVGDTTAESGSNAGSNFALYNYTDAGGFIGTVLSANRATSVVNFAVPPTIAGAPIVSGASISDAAPSSPQAGQLWFESDSGNTYIYYNDGNTSQWVQINIASNPAIGQTAETRNRLVNPAMQISQEWANSALGPTGVMNSYAADQWLGVNSTTGTLTQQRVQVVTPNGSQNRIRLTVNTADASLAAGEFQNLAQLVEGIRTADFRWGSASAKQIVVRFGWKSPAGTYTVGIGNAAANRSYIANFTITAGQANTDTEQALVIPGDVTGTWVVDSTNPGLSLRFNIGAGTTFQGVAGWQAGNLLSIAGNTNGMATAGAVYELYDVGLYLDPLNTGVAPPWVMPDEAAELIACQRYFEKVSTGGVWGYNTAGQAINAPIAMKVTKRIVPAVSAAISNAATANMTGIGAGFASVDGFLYGGTVTATGTAYQVSVVMNANARM